MVPALHCTGRVRQGREDAERKRVGKVEGELTESQGRCSDSVIPSWKESCFVLNLVASGFQDVAGSLDLSGACLFTRFLGPGTEGCERKLPQWDTKRNQRAFKILLALPVEIIIN